MAKVSQFRHGEIKIKYAVPFPISIPKVMDSRLWTVENGTHVNNNKQFSNVQKAFIRDNSPNNYKLNKYNIMIKI